MTARQPPGEKGAKACTIGCDLSRDGYFCAYFSGETTKKESKMMKNGARYIVETRWGVFSLDEGAYKDYLAGKLWITWEPGKKNGGGKPAGDYMPPDISDKAVQLREQADKIGVMETLQKLGVYDAVVPYSARFDDESIDELNLTVRSSNGLKRANAGTFGKLKEILEREGGIMSVRNLGQKSAKEIKELFFEECYLRLLPYERAIYWEEILQIQTQHN